MENEADIPRKCQGHEGGVERHGRDMTRTSWEACQGHEGEIKKKASSEMTVQGHQGAVPDIEATQGGRDAAMQRERERARKREREREREKERD